MPEDLLEVQQPSLITELEKSVQAFREERKAPVETTVAPIVPAAETPIVETPIEKVVPITEPIQVETKTEPNEAYEAMLAELSGFKSKYESLSSDPVFAELLAVKEKGGVITPKYLQEAFIDYDSPAFDTNKMDVARDLLKSSLIDEGLTAKEAELQIRVEFNELFDDKSDENSDTFQLQQAKLSRLASQYVQKKKQNQLNIKNTPTSPTNKEDVIRELHGLAKTQLDDKKQRLSQAADEVFKSRKTVDINFEFKNERDESVPAKIHAEITEDIKKEISKAMKNPVIMDAIAQVVDLKQPADSLDADILQRLLMLCKPDLYRSLIANEAAAQQGKGILSRINPADPTLKYGEVAGVDKSKFDLTTRMGQLEYAAAVNQARKKQV